MATVSRTTQPVFTLASVRNKLTNIRLNFAKSEKKIMDFAGRITLAERLDKKFKDGQMRAELSRMSKVYLKAYNDLSRATKAFPQLEIKDEDRKRCFSIYVYSKRLLRRLEYLSGELDKLPPIPHIDPFDEFQEHLDLAKELGVKFDK